MQTSINIVPLEFVAKELLAYLAGIVDGEGCVTIARTRPTKANPVGNWRPSLRITMTDREAIDLFSQTFGGSVCARPPAKAHYRAFFEWSIHSSSATKILRALLPFMRIKARQANVCIQLQDCKRPKSGAGGGGNPLTQSEIDQRNALWLEIHNLNRRGKQRKTVEWPKATAKRPRPLVTACQHGHNDFIYRNYTCSKTGKCKRKRLCRPCGNERARKYRIANRGITVISRKTA